MRSQLAVRILTSALSVTASRCFIVAPSAASLSTKRSSLLSLLSSLRSTPNSICSVRRWMSSTSTSTSSNTMTAPTIPPESLQAIESLEPKALWKHFAAISSIPRPSKHEEAVLQYIIDFAKERNLPYKQDAVGNLVVFHPGTCPNANPVILQGHVDMVTEKNSETIHNFETDPIVLELVNNYNNNKDKKEQWLTARGTTLGADNGIGVAATLALLEISPNDTSVKIPPLQALFTVDEETGLTGATDLDVQALGLTASTMLNLDTEEWGELYVGCAGGGESILELPLKRTTTTTASPSKTTLVELQVQGLMGGHSGINIHEGRANAVLLCALALQDIILQQETVSLISFSGGDKHNAIPREAKAILAVPDDPKDSLETLQTIVQKRQQAAQAEFGILETNLRMQIKKVTNDDNNNNNHSNPLEMDSTRRLLSMLLSLPHGPIKMSHSIPDLVETSNNVASLSMSAEKATVLCSTRSSIQTALEATRDKLAAVAYLAGATMTRSEAYPGWNPNMNSPLLQMTQQLLQSKLNNVGKTPGIKAIHAGLECGLLIEKLGGTVDTLSFGPTITGAHSPDEQVKIDTVLPFFELVQDILQELAKQQASQSPPSKQ